MSTPSPLLQGSRRNRIKSSNWQFWAIIALPLLYVAVFLYAPMGGIAMAFVDYSPRRGIFGSPFVGFKWFNQYLTTPSGLSTIANTLRIGIYSLLAGFPIPILLAIGINEVNSRKFKKTVQMVTYAPYFISVVVMVGMLMQFTDLRLGIINRLIAASGGKPINFFGSAAIFPHLYVWSGIWQTMGYSSILYLAALSGVSKELQEAAIVDGATRLKRIWHVDLPEISSTLIIMLFFSIGSIMSVGFEKVYLMQNALNTRSSEIISTFVYKVGLQNGNYSFSTAVGLFNSLVGFVLLVGVNRLSRKLTDTSVW
mgnify:FL=1